MSKKERTLELWRIVNKYLPGYVTGRLLDQFPRPGYCTMDVHGLWLAVYSHLPIHVLNQVADRFPELAPHAIVQANIRMKFEIVDLITS